MKFIYALTISSILSLFAVVPAPPPPPNGSWGNFVYFYTQATSISTIQANATDVFSTNEQIAKNGFLNQGYAFLFAPGSYTGLNIQVGYYTSIIGLGEMASQTTINSVNSFDSTPRICIGALRNFWRSLENFQTMPQQQRINAKDPTSTVIGMTWAAAHGSFLRNIIVNGRLYLSDLGASNGAFIANCNFSNLVDPNGGIGSAVYSAQRQLLLRNTTISASSSLGPVQPWDSQFGRGFVWAQTFVNCIGAPSTACVLPTSRCLNRICPESLGLSQNTASACFPNQITNIAIPSLDEPVVPLSQESLLMAEKPFISYDAPNFSLIIPPIATSSLGFQATFAGSEKISFNNVYVATPNDTAQIINTKINDPNFRAVILTPGTYSLTETIRIDQANKVLLGIGFPILVAPDEEVCIQVTNVDGVRVGGIILQAGNEGRLLLQWGTEDREPVTSGFLYDCFARVGRFTSGDVTCKNVIAMIEILASNIVCDNVWAWRADSDAFGANVACNNCDVGALMKGDHITTFGLTCENVFENQVEWFGNNGRSYSFQGTFPADGTKGRDLHDYGFCGYLVDTHVTNHLAYDTGVYSSLNDEYVVPNGIVTPCSSNIKFRGALTRILAGNATISAVLNGAGQNLIVVSGNPNLPPPNDVLIGTRVTGLNPGPAYLPNCVWSGSQPKAAFSQSRRIVFMAQ